MTQVVQVRRTDSGRRVVVFATLALAFYCGCGNELVIHPVHGMVTIDGQPVPYGEMNVDPLSTSANSGRSVVSRIINGKYDLRPAGLAAGPAEYIITVVDTSKFKIRDVDNITPDEDSKIMMARKLLFSEKVEVDREVIDISLRSENGEKKTPRAG